MSGARPDVVHILPLGAPLRGAERYARDVLTGTRLAHLDQRVAFLRGAPDPGWPAERVLRGPRALGPLGTVAAVARARPRIVHGWLLWGNLAAALVKLVRPSVRVVASEQNVGHALGPGKRLLERLVARLEDVATANCPAVREAAVRRLPRRAPSLVVIEGGIAPLRPPDSTLPCDCVVVGRLEPVKDHATALRAWARVVERRPGATLALMGGGPERQRLELLARELRIDGAVRFAGEGDPRPFLFGAQAFLLTSRAEGLPRTVLEAFSAGVPVVATDVGGVGDMPADALLRAPAGDHEAIADTLLELLGDGAQRERLAAAGRAAAAERFGLSRYQDSHLRLYQRLAA